jgi:hypothetical protein
MKRSELKRIIHEEIMNIMEERKKKASGWSSWRKKTGKSPSGWGDWRKKKADKEKEAKEKSATSQPTSSGTSGKKTRKKITTRGTGQRNSSKGWGTVPAVHGRKMTRAQIERREKIGQKILSAIADGDNKKNKLRKAFIKWAIKNDFPIDSEQKMKSYAWAMASDWAIKGKTFPPPGKNSQLSLDLGDKKKRKKPGKKSDKSSTGTSTKSKKSDSDQLKLDL